MNVLKHRRPRHDQVLAALPQTDAHLHSLARPVSAIRVIELEEDIDGGSGRIRGRRPDRLRLPASGPAFVPSGAMFAGSAGSIAAIGRVHRHAHPEAVLSFDGEERRTGRHELSRRNMQLREHAGLLG